MADLTTQIRQALQAQSFPIPSPSWLQSLIGARLPPPALQSLVATAKARILAADLTSPNFLDASSTASFPPDVANAEIKETKLTRDIVVQVLDVENLSRSRWEQVEDLEAIERGEQRAGRRIVRLPTAAERQEEDGDGPASTSNQGSSAAAQSERPAGNGTHRLLLQDCNGVRIYALELKRIPRIGVGSTQMGEKMLLRAGSVIARGMVLLEPATCSILGGKVDAWQAAWLSGRLQRLRDAVGAEDRPR
jgi:RecQ-mediated genome instability protein 1